MASNSAWAVGSLRATVALYALETTTPSRVTTAPTGTSSSSIASLAWASAASIPARSGWSGTSRFRRARRHSLEAERIAVLRPVHPYPVAFGELPLEHGERQRILQQPLDRPLERPRAVHRVVAFRHDQLLRRRPHLEGELALRHEPLHALDLEIDDARDVLEQHPGIGPPAHRLGELAALFVPDVARRGADHPRHGVLLHVLGHVEPHHRLLVVEQEFGEGARGLGLADPGRTEEDERPG